MKNKPDSSVVFAPETWLYIVGLTFVHSVIFAVITALLYLGYKSANMLLSETSARLFPNKSRADYSNKSENKINSLYCVTCLALNLSLSK